MKRFGLIAMLLLGVVPYAYADNDIYHNITKHRRGDDVLQADPDTARRCRAHRRTTRRPRKPTRAACSLAAGATAIRSASVRGAMACIPIPIIPG